LEDAASETPSQQPEPASAQLESKIAGESMRQQAESTSAPGESKRLFSLINPSCFTMLLANFDDTSAVRRQLAQLTSPLQQFTDLIEISRPEGDAGKPYEDCFGLHPSITFIRPDAYVGFRGGESSVVDFVKYCGRWFPPAAERQAA